MSWESWASLALGLGLGGLAGAAAGLALSVSRLGSALKEFDHEFKTFVAGKSDQQTQRLAKLFEAVATQIKDAEAKLKRLKDALRWR